MDSMSTEQVFGNQTYSSIFGTTLCLMFLFVAQNIFVKLRIKPRHLKAGDSMYCDKHNAGFLTEISTPMLCIAISHGKSGSHICRLEASSARHAYMDVIQEGAGLVLPGKSSRRPNVLELIAFSS